MSGHPSGRDLAPQGIVDLGLAAAGDRGADGAVLLVDDTAAANLRFANNTLTTNGVEHRRAVTAIVIRGASAGVVSRSGLFDADLLADLVDAADAVARVNPAAEDAGALVLEKDEGVAEWGEPPADTGMRVLAGVVDGLAGAFDAARSADRLLFGFARHEVRTTYLGTSAGVRRRHVQPSGSLDLTGRGAGGDGGEVSAWAGRATRDFADVEVATLAAEVSRRLDWSRRRLELPAGRYETLLPPSAVADLLAYLYWAMSARAAVEGRTALSRPGGGTRIGERLADLPLTLRSDPVEPGLGCAPFVTAVASGEDSSVFDNGLKLGPTDWLRDGTLTALHATRHAAALTGLPVAPPVDNLVFEGPSGGPDLDRMIAATDRGLLLTCLWYIRMVDPQTLLLTGLTRDGVFRVESGEVVGLVNNFRFNDSPVDLLRRIVEVGPTAPTLAREFQEDLTRVAAAPVRVPDFHFSTVSQAS